MVRMHMDQHNNIQHLFLFRYNVIEELDSAIDDLLDKTMLNPPERFKQIVTICRDVPSACRGLFIMASDNNELERKLHLIKSTISSGKLLHFPLNEKIAIAEIPEAPAKIVFLFPGFGSEYSKMIDGLYDQFPFIEKWISMLKSFIEGASGPVPETSEIEKVVQDYLINNSSSLFKTGSVGIVTSLIFKEILNKLRVPCDFMLGHSNGENAAMVASGIFRFDGEEELCKIIKSVVQVVGTIKSSFNGNYLAINNYSSEKMEVLLKTFEGEVYVAMKNCPNQTVLYVLDEKLEAVKNMIFSERGIAVPLSTDNPYHTPFYKENIPLIRDVYSSFSIGAGHTPLYSCVDTHSFEGSREQIIEKAILQWTEKVDFAGTIQNLYNKGATIFIEVGPNNRLTNFVKDILKGKKHLALASNLHGKKNTETLLEMGGMLWINGVGVDFNAFESAETRSSVIVVPLADESKGNKNYASVKVFKRHQELMQYYLEVQERMLSKYIQAVEKRKSMEEVEIQPEDCYPFQREEWPFLTEPIIVSKRKIHFKKQYDLEQNPIFKDHALGKKLAVIPFTLSLEIIAEAAAYLFKSELKVVEIKDVASFLWLALENDRLNVEIIAEERETPNSELIKEVRVCIYESDTKSGTVKKAFEGTVCLSGKYTTSPADKVLQGALFGKDFKDASDFYEEHLFHGNHFVSIESVNFSNADTVTARMIMPSVKQAFKEIRYPVFQIPGAFLDCSGQLAAYWLLQRNMRDHAVFPFQVKSYKQYAAFPAEGSFLMCHGSFYESRGTIEATFIIYSTANELLAELQGFRLRLFQDPLIPQLLLNRFLHENDMDLTFEFLQEGGGIWARVLASLLLEQEDYNTWLALKGDDLTRFEMLVSKFQFSDTHNLKHLEHGKTN